MELRTQQHQSAIASLQKMATDATQQMSQMDGALVSCKNELHVQFDQLDEMRDQHDREISARDEQVSEHIDTRSQHG